MKRFLLFASLAFAALTVASSFNPSLHAQSDGTLPTSVILPRLANLEQNQKAIEANEQAIDQQLSALEESMRYVRIYSSRAGKKMEEKK